MPDCIFCKIITGEIPSNKIYEDDRILAFLDIHPISRGHSLVVPKIHSKNFLETEETVLNAVVAAAKKIAPAIISAVGASGFNFTVANGETAGQSVFHLHFHIIPRFSKDELKDWPPTESEAKTRAEITEKIKKNL